MSVGVMQADAIGGQGFLDASVGFEQIGRACRLALAGGLNDEIDRQKARWDEADLVLQQLGFDEGVGQIDIDHVEDANLFEGPHKSLADSPVEMFPNVSVMAYMAVPSPFQLDQTMRSDITLFVESMAIAGPVPDGQEVAFETIVHRKIQRMTEAVAIVIKRSGNLLGTVEPIAAPPRGGIGTPTWLKGANKGSGPRHLWHGSRLQYTLQRQAALS